MLEDKKIEEAKRNAQKSIDSGKIIKLKEGRYVEFFLKNAKDSLDSAKVLFDLTNNQKSRENLGIPPFNGLLWVINSSYYSMFYMVRALLENSGIKIESDESVHFTVFNALIYYFYSNKKLEKHFIEDFEEAQKDSAEILGKEKAKELITEYATEKEKRARFTYEIGEIAMKSKAETSLNRAKRFNEEIRKMLQK